MAWSNTQPSGPISVGNGMFIDPVTGQLVGGAVGAAASRFPADLNDLPKPQLPTDPAQIAARNARRAAFTNGDVYGAGQIGIPQAPPGGQPAPAIAQPVPQGVPQGSQQAAGASPYGMDSGLPFAGPSGNPLDAMRGGPPGVPPGPPPQVPQQAPQGTPSVPQGGPPAPPVGSPMGAPQGPSAGPQAAPSGQPDIGGDLTSFVMNQEGYRDKAYPDGPGRYSIGFGTRASGPNDTIDRPKAESDMKSHLAGNLQTVLSTADATGLHLSPSQVTALASFDYNTGAAGKIIEQARGDLAAIPALMQSYTTSGGKENPGLAKRRSAEIAMFTGQPYDTNYSGNAEAGPPGQDPGMTGQTNDLTQQVRGPGQGALPGVGAASFDPKAYMPSRGDQMLALGSGLLAGPTFGQGLSKGLVAMNGLNQQGRDNSRRGQQLAQTAAYQNAMLPQKQQLADAQTTRAVTGQVRAETGQETNDIKRETNALRDKTLQINLEKYLGRPAQQAEVATYKNSIKGRDELLDHATTADRNMRTIDNVLVGLDHNEFPGSSIYNQLQVTMAKTLGVQVGRFNPSAVQLDEKQMRDLQVQVAKSFGISIRSNIELNNLMSAFAGAGTNPEAIRAILLEHRSQMQATRDARDSWLAMPQDKRDKIMGGEGFQTWISAQERDHLKTDGPTIGRDSEGAPVFNGTTGKTASGVSFTISP